MKARNKTTRHAQDLSRLGILLAGLCMPAGHVLLAATASATVSANIVSTISISNTTGMQFGDISTSTTAGTVVISPDGTRTSTGGASVNTATSGGPASFAITGDPNASFAVTLPISVTISSPGGNTMLVDSFTSNPATTGLLSASGTQTLLVGSTLHVGVLQPFGSYTGIMAVTVDYN